MLISDDITKNKITCACLDDRQRKIIVGDTKGGIFVFNFNNGSLLRELTPHTGEISALVYASEKSVISASWDCKICIHNELAPHNTSSVVRAVNWYDKNSKLCDHLH